MDGTLFNQRRLQAVTKVKETVLRDFLFADDCALNASPEPEMQHSMDKLSSACKNFGLTITSKKIEVLHQPAPNNPTREPSIQVNKQKLHAADRFTYLGSTLSRSLTADDEVNSRIAKGRSAFGTNQATWRATQTRKSNRQQTFDFFLPAKNTQSQHKVLCINTRGCLLGGVYVPCVYRMPGGVIEDDSGLCCLLGGVYVPCVCRMPGGVIEGDSGLCCCGPAGATRKQY